MAQPSTTPTTPRLPLKYVAGCIPEQKDSLRFLVDSLDGQGPTFIDRIAHCLPVCHPYYEAPPPHVIALPFLRSTTQKVTALSADFGTLQSADVSNRERALLPKAWTQRGRVPLGLHDVAKQIVIWDSLFWAIDISRVDDQEWPAQRLNDLKASAFMPTLQWVINGQPMVPIIDMDGYRDTDGPQPSIDSIVGWMGQRYRSEINFLVFGRPPLNKYHIYMLNCRLLVEDIKAIITELAAQFPTCIFDSELYNGTNHTIRAPGCFKNGWHFDAADALDPSTRSSYIPVVSPVIDSELTLLRLNCEHCQSTARVETVPFYDFSDPCTRCHLMLWKHLLEMACPYMTKAQTKYYRTYEECIRPGSLTEEQQNFLRLAMNHQVPDELPTPFEAARRTDPPCAEDLRAKLQTQLEIIGGDGDEVLVGQCLSFLDSALLLISEVFHREGLTGLHVLMKGTYGPTTEQIDKLSQYFANNYLSPLIHSFRVEKRCPLSNFKTSHPLGAPHIFAVQVKSCICTIKFDIKKATDTLKPSETGWIPYNPIVVQRRKADPGKFNTYVPFPPKMTHQYEPVLDRTTFLEQLYFLMWCLYRYTFISTDPDPVVRGKIYVLYWQFLAYKVQFPGGVDGEFINTTLTWVFLGVEGCGKSLAASGFPQALFGQNYTRQASGQFGQFTAHSLIKNGLYVVCDEVALAPAIERALTNKVIPTEGKWEAQKMTRNFTTIMKAQNNLRINGSGGMSERQVNTSDRRQELVAGYEGRIPLEFCEIIDQLLPVSASALTGAPFARDLYFYLSFGFPEVRTTDGLRDFDLAESDLPVYEEFKKAFLAVVGTWRYMSASITDSPDAYRVMAMKLGSHQAIPSEAKIQHLIIPFMPPEENFLFELLDLGTSVGAAFHNLPLACLKMQHWWDDQGYWLRMVPLKDLAGLYIAFKSLRKASRQNDSKWAHLISQSWCRGQQLPCESFDEFCALSETDQLAKGPRLLTSSNNLWAWIPTLSECRDNWNGYNHLEHKWTERNYDREMEMRDDIVPNLVSYTVGFEGRQPTGSEYIDQSAPVQEKNLFDLRALPAGSFLHLRFSRAFAVVPLISKTPTQLQATLTSLYNRECVQSYHFWVAGSHGFSGRMRHWENSLDRPKHVIIPADEATQSHYKRHEGIGPFIRVAYDSDDDLTLDGPPVARDGMP